MGFFDFFRPRWRHSDADVRAEAVRQLSAEDLRLLSEVVRRDQDARIRRIALKKIDDPSLLGEIAESDPDESLRRDAAEKAAELMLGTALGDDERAAVAALEKIGAQKALAEVARKAAVGAVRRSALARITDAKAIADVARKSDDPFVRRQAVDRVSEPAVLREIAIGDAAKEVALAAAERLDDPKMLEVVLKKSKSKAVKALMKDKIAARNVEQRKADPAGLTEAKRRSRQALLCRTVEEAAASDDWDHSAAAIEVAKQGWAELGKAAGDEPFQKRFDRSLARFELRREEVKARQRASAAAEQRKVAAREAEARRSEEETVERAARSAEDQKLAEIADGAKKEEDERRAVERTRRNDEKALRDAEKKKKDDERSAERARKDAESVDNGKRVEEACLRLESLAGNDDKKLVDAALKSAADLMQTVGGNLPREGGKALRDRYDSARSKLVIRAQELREAEDWKRWSNVPRLEALCVKMDAVLLLEDLKEAGAQMKALQAEWKTVGAAPKEKSEALWKRFKATADQVYEKIKGVTPAVSDEDRAANLKKKEELCVRVEELAAKPDVHFKETSEQIKALQEEWKGIGQVGKEQSDAIWKRFRGACDQFFGRRKEHFAELDSSRADNLKKQEALCAEAEALAQSSDWKGAAEQLKGMQADWKNIGPGPKDQADAVWNRFRAACDVFFERRKAHFAEMDEERAGNLKKKLLLCEKAEALGAADDHEAAKSEAKKLQSEWKAIGPVPKDDSDAIWERFRGACDRIFAAERMPEPAADDLPPPPSVAPKWENKLLAEKLGALDPAPRPEKKAKTKPVEAPKPVEEVKPVLSEAAQELQAAASEWEDIATGVGFDPTKK